MVISMLKKYKFDKFIIFSLFIFFIISTTSIYSALTYLSPTLGNLALKQALWYFMGCIIIFIVIKLGNSIFYKYALYPYYWTF